MRAFALSNDVENESMDARAGETKMPPIRLAKIDATKARLKNLDLLTKTDIFLIAMICDFSLLPRRVYLSI